MQNGKISVVSVLRSEDPKGYIILFSEGNKKHPTHFPPSFFTGEEQKNLDYERFLTWCAMKSPFEKQHISVPLMMELGALVENKLAELP